MRTTEVLFVCARGSLCEHACILSVRAEGFALRDPESLFHNFVRTFHSVDSRAGNRSASSSE
jgi:hypothetical protein